MGYIESLRKKIGHDPVLMPCGSVLILDGDRILLQRRRDNGLWTYPGGAMEPGETFEQTAVREAKEESGLTCKALEPFWLRSGAELRHVYPNGDIVYIVDEIFLCREFESEPKIQEEEVVEQRFFPLDALPADLTPLARPVLEKLRSTLKINA